MKLGRLLLASILFFLCTMNLPAQGSAQTETQKVGEKAEKALKTLLDRKLPMVRFTADGFSDVVDFFRDATGANICMDWPAIEAAGVARDTPVTYKSSDTKFSDTLVETLSKAAGDPRKVSYCIDAGVIYISTPDGVKAFQALWKKHAEMSTDTLTKFKATMPEVRFNANRFGDVIDFLRDSTGFAFETDWDQMKKDGIEKDTPITLDLRKAPTLLSFQLIAQSASNEKAAVDFRIDGGKVVFFSTPMKKR